MTSNQKAKIKTKSINTLFYIFTVLITILSIAPTLVSVLLAFMKEKGSHVWAMLEPYLKGYDQRQKLLQK